MAFEDIPWPFPRKVMDMYKIIKEIDSGFYGELLQICEKKTKTKHTMKKIMKTAEQLWNITTDIKHPHFLLVKQRVPMRNSLFVVSEFMNGGDLASKIGKYRSIPEEQAKFCFYQVTLALQHLHNNVGIPHCNLKPQNILFSSACLDNCLVKLSDHGVSKADPGRCERKKEANKIYEAPEVKKRCGASQYSIRSDMWTLGAIIFRSLTGMRPKIEDDLKMKDFPNGSSISQLVKDLLLKLMVKDSLQRLDADAVLDHEWLQDNIMKEKVACLTDLWKETQDVLEVVSMDVLGTENIPEYLPEPVNIPEDVPESKGLIFILPGVSVRSCEKLQ